MARRSTHPHGRRRTLGALSAAGVVALAGGAVAYWTGGGTGTGSGTTATGLQGVTVVQTSTITDLAPGSGTQALSGTFDNANAAPVYVTAVTATVSVTKASGAPAGACTAADYVIAGTAPVAALVPAGTGQGSWSGLTIAFKSSGDNQDGCKGATLSIAYAAT